MLEFIITAMIPYNFRRFLPLIGLTLFWRCSTLLSSIYYWIVIWRCSSIWKNILCRNRWRRDSFIKKVGWYIKISPWFQRWEPHRIISAKFIIWYWRTSWINNITILRVKRNDLWYSSITLTLTLASNHIYPAPLARQIEYVAANKWDIYICQSPFWCTNPDWYQKYHWIFIQLYCHCLPDE